MLLAKRAVILRIIMLLGLLSMVLMTFPLWQVDRIFPMSPLVHFPQIFKQNAFMFFLFFIGLLVLLLFTNNQYIFISFLLLLVFLILQDINRLQTWTYIYVLLLLPLLIYKDEIKAVDVVQLILIGVYLWSGLNKFNQNFIDETGQKIFTEIFRLNVQDAKKIELVAYIIPITQVVLSIGLIFKSTRRFSVMATIVMHLIICCVFLPLVHSDNMEIIPWNISMIFLVFFSFYKYEDDLFKNLKMGFTKLIFCLVVFILPLGYYANIWPHNLSFHLYSSRNRLFYVAISHQYWPLVEKECHDYLVELPDGATGGVIIDMNRWSMKELHVATFPEIYAYKGSSYFFCDRGIPANHIQFMSFGHRLDPASLIKWSCGDH
jgi:hypothetical protein